MNPTMTRSIPRGSIPLVLLVLVAMLVTGPGCQSWTNRKKEEPFQKEARLMKEKLRDPDRPRLVGEIASAMGLAVRRFDTVGIVSNLPGTGGEVAPSPQREMILKDMRRHEVSNPEQFIDSKTTAAAKVRVYSFPGDSKADALDVLVECSTVCSATDFRDGYLMPSILRDYGFGNGKTLEGNEQATAGGEVVVIPASVAGDETLNTLRGVVIGGAKLLEAPNDAPKLGIRLDKEWRHVMVVKGIEKAINRRFFFRDGSRQQKVSEGKNDWRLEIAMVPKYRWDPLHYMSTLMSVGFNETDEQIAERIEGCRKLLIRRETARRAACELEAIGTGPAIAVLREGLACDDTEVRFHSAYSLAYLDRPECVPILQELAIRQPEFRSSCLIGLGADEDPSAREALNELLQEPEPELRYGAFLAIRQKEPRDPIVVGDKIGDAFHLVKIPSKQPMVAVSLEQRKELVLYGGNATITLNVELAPTPSFRLVPLKGGLMRVVKRRSDGEILHSIVSNDLTSLLQALPNVGANYGDIVQTLDELGRGGQLSIPVALNPRPRAGRIYHRDQNETQSGVEELESIQVDGASRASTKPKRNWIQLASWPNLNPSKTAESRGQDDEATDETKDERGNP